MNDPVVLTFAEIEFLLRSAGQVDPVVRERLHLRPEAAVDLVVEAGLSSLLARGLCSAEGERPVPGGLVVTAIAALSDVRTAAEAFGWVEDRPVVLHILAAPHARLALAPASYGRFTAELLDPREPLAAPLTRLLESASKGSREVAFAARSTSEGQPETSVAVARDEAGAWFLSDTSQSPDRGRPVSHGDVVRRIGELFGAAPVAVAGR